MYILLLFFFLLQDHLQGPVVGVQDGDTITILVDTSAVRIRLYGIDCPEKGQDFAGVARERVSALCFKKTVSVQVRGKDRFGRILGDVFLEDCRHLNRLLVEEGLAWWFKKYSPKDEHLKALEATAKRARKGIWSVAEPVPPWEYRKEPK